MIIFFTKLEHIYESKPLLSNLKFIVMASSNNYAGILLGMGNPLLDISSLVDDEFLTKLNNLISISFFGWIRLVFRLNLKFIFLLSSNIRFWFAFQIRRQVELCDSRWGETLADVTIAFALRLIFEYKLYTIICDILGPNSFGWWLTF